LGDKVASGGDGFPAQIAAQIHGKFTGGLIAME
jgi:hypothetical protein